MNYKIVILILLLQGCNKDGFKDYRYTYCYKVEEDDRYWGCSNFVMDQKMNLADSTRVHTLLDNKIKKTLGDTTYFRSKIEFLSDEHSWRTPRLKTKKLEL